MTDETLIALIHQLIDGTIDEADHQTLEQRLLHDAAARDVFRERMDVEAALHTWAVEDAAPIAGSPPVPAPAAHRDGRLSGRARAVGLTGAVAMLAIAAVLVAVIRHSLPDPAGVITQTPGESPAAADATLGQLVQQADCRWGHKPDGGRFSSGPLELKQGVAELRFDSGTRVVLESPCKVHVDSSDTAHLLTGSVFVAVSEVSNGFLLTTPDAQIVDDGTQYAVACDTAGTEVHVFDGSVLWMTADTSAATSARIESGEARRVSRGAPGALQRVPFGQRQFVRQIEMNLRDIAGTSLVAYDGFENLAGRMRRGRSGFGWAKGWESAGRGGGPLGEVSDAPDDVVFQMPRSGRRLLLAVDGVDMRRTLATPLNTSTANVYVSVIARRAGSAGSVRDQSKPVSGQSSFQLLLEPDAVSPRFTRRHSVSFGVTSAATAFINNAGRVQEAVTQFADNQTCLLVFRYSAGPSDSTASLRIYAPGDLVEATEPDAWHIVDRGAAATTNIRSVRLVTGRDATWQFDELKMGTSWAAVLPAAVVPEVTPESVRQL